MNRSDITYQDKIDELRLDISHPNSNGVTFILLEGETDIRLFKKIYTKNCKIESIPGGKIKLEEGVNELLNHCPLIIGIRDADFIHINNEVYNKPNMFITDFHDIEMSAIREDDIFSALLYEFTNISQEDHDTYRTRILDVLLNVSYIKWINEIENLELSFKINFQDLLCFESFNLNIQEYLLRAVSKSTQPRETDVEILLQKINDAKSNNFDLYHVANGHDFMKALSQFIRVKGNTNDLSDTRLASSLRVAFTNEHFIKTSLSQNIMNWANNNNITLN